MTRLTTDDIQDISGQLVKYDRLLVSATGRTLLGLAAWASGFSLSDVTHFERITSGIKMAVVPVSSGLGVVSGFTEAVCGILVHLGFNASVTRHPDVAGFADAVDMGAQIIFAADDNRFVAICPRQGTTLDNSRATARGFVAGLDLMAGGLAGKDVLVLGCGLVGRWAVEALLTRKARVCVVDRELQKAQNTAAWAREAFRAAVRVAADLDQAILNYHMIVEATNAAEVIRARHVTADTRVAAPGMPCGITRRAREKLDGRLLHDPLQIGVAVMACEAVRIVYEKPNPVLPAGHDGGSP
jgi:3-methylornithyl-N6-L-lysine dehydrogenase